MCVCVCACVCVCGRLFVVCTVMQHHLIPCTWMVVRHNYGEQILNQHFYNVFGFHFNQKKTFLKFLPITLYDNYALHMNNWNLQFSRWRFWSKCTICSTPCHIWAVVYTSGLINLHQKALDTGVNSLLHSGCLCKPRV